MAKTKSEVAPTTLAASLYSVQGQIAFLREQEDELKEQLMGIMKSQAVKTVKLEDGTQFIRTERQNLKVTDEEKAKDWLDENYCWKPDTGKALQLIRRSLKKPPKFFKVETSEYLTIKRSWKPPAKW